MIQTPYTLDTRYIRCPGCGEGEHLVSHLPIGAVTLWYCDECGCQFRVNVLAEDRIETEVDQRERKIKTLVTLRSEGPVTLIVEGMHFIRESDPPEGWPNELGSSDAFFYNEHTCPTNYMPCVVKVIDAAGDEDPHGIFAYVKTEPWRDLENDDSKGEK